MLKDCTALNNLKKTIYCCVVTHETQYIVADGLLLSICFLNFFIKIFRRGEKIFSGTTEKNAGSFKNRFDITTVPAGASNVFLPSERNSRTSVFSISPTENKNGKIHRKFTPFLQEFYRAAKILETVPFNCRSASTIQARAPEFSCQDAAVESSAC